MTVNLNIVEKCVSCLNIKESYDLARRMEQEKTNPVLGYRTAGSLAERKTGDMLLEEMKKAGLTQVEKDKIRVDAWEFKKAVSVGSMMLSGMARQTEYSLLPNT